MRAVDKDTKDSRCQKGCAAAKTGDSARFMQANGDNLQKMIIFTSADDMEMRPVFFPAQTRALWALESILKYVTSIWRDKTDENKTTDIPYSGSSHFSAFLLLRRGAPSGFASGTGHLLREGYSLCQP